VFFPFHDGLLRAASVLVAHKSIRQAAFARARRLGKPATFTPTGRNAQRAPGQPRPSCVRA
jgi:hypothetical protein